MTWNHNIKAAPHSKSQRRVISTTKGERAYNEIQHEYLILETKCGKVLKSYWIPDEERWAGLATGEEPIAWQEWPKPSRAQIAA
jgi:hypothetical protein